MSKESFKVGDRVVVVDGSGTGMKVGTEGVVSRICHDLPYPYYVKFSDSVSAPFKAEQLGLVGVERVEEPKFKIGDRVRFHDEDGSTRDDIGVLTRFDESRNHWWANWENTGREQHCDSKYLTLLESAPTHILNVSGKKYLVLKPISGETIWDGGRYKGCAEWRKEFNEFVKQYGYTASWKFVYTWFDEEHPKWLSWLIEHGYLKEVERKKVQRKVVIEKVRWKSDSCTYPADPTTNFRWTSLLKKPPMKMTLEWEEEE